MPAANLPISPEHVFAALRSAGWVSRPIVGLELEPLSSRVHRAHLHYDEPCRRLDGGNPERIVIKSTEGPATTEVDIYGRSGETPAVPTPRAVALQGRDGSTVALLLADVGPTNVELSARALRLAVDRLARMHAHFWDAPSTASVDPRTAPKTLVHGGLSASHTLIDRGRVHFVGWGAAKRAPGVLDLAALIETAPSHQEWELVLRYHAGLVRGGVQKYARGRCWGDYARAVGDIRPSRTSLAA